MNFAVVLPELPKLQPCVGTTPVWWQWHPPVGVFIAVLALVGVLIPWLRGEGKRVDRHERAFWTIVMFVCLGLELNSIYQDQTQHKKEETFARCEQLHSFQEIGQSLQSSIAQNEQGFKDTIGPLKQTLEASTMAVNQTRPFADVQFKGLSPQRFYKETGLPLPTPILTGGPTKINYHFSNGGNDTAQMYGGLALAFVGKPDDADSEREIMRQFEIEWNKKKVNQSPIAETPGQDSFNEFTAGPWSEADQSGIAAGTKTIYYVIRFAYGDRTGRWFSDYCSNLQTPATSYIGTRHPCRLPSNGRYHSSTWQ
ncbi:MAG: hypothetical protein JWQ49_4578 [Edaphobacter sp.]|nr:hypothetical protein [Edaphobacter sp.]